MRLSARQLCKQYGAVTVLSDVDLDLPAGEIRALVGENGAGKSTLIKILSGAVRPDGGWVSLDGVPVPAGDPRETQRRGISIVYQEFTLVPDLSVAENIFLGRELGTGPSSRAAMRRRAQAVLGELGVTVDAAAPVRGLSVAHQQMVEIARALVTEASVLILDEPSATLSAHEVEVLLEVLRRLRARGLAILYVSHRLEEVFAIADSVTVLRDGRHVTTQATDGLSREALIGHMVGRAVTEEFPPRTGRPGDVVLDVVGLSVPGRCTDVSLQVRRGEIVGLAGLVGAGRTSAALAIVGAVPSSGRVVLNGQSVSFQSPDRAIRAGIAYVTEDRKTCGLFPLLGVGENITITHLHRLCRAGVLRRRRDRAAAEGAIEAFDIRARGVAQAAGTLSGGNQQKALVARYLVEPPHVLILDEPTRGVDVAARAEIYGAMNRLTAQGLGILMISSDLPEVLGMSDRVVVMRGGRTSGELSRDEATPERVMMLATMPVAAAVPA